MKKDLKKRTHDHVHEAFKEAHFEDRMWFLWRRYKKHTFLFILFIVLVMGGIQGVSLFKRYQLRQLQEEYQDARDDAQKLLFAERNPSEPLSGTVFLRFGDNAYRKGQYSEAAKYYMQALKALRNTILTGRASMSLAMAHYMGEERVKGREGLKFIYGDARGMEVIRAEAAYQLALIALEEKNYEACQEYVSAIARMPEAGIWSQKALGLTQITPELFK